MVNQKIKINNIEYEVLESKEKITVPDCLSYNKVGQGHGESKLYVGNRSQFNLSFFKEISDNCFFLKSDLIEYLNNVKEEYFDPQQQYKNKLEMSNKWQMYFSEINNLEDQLNFNLTYLNNLVPPRMYLNSKDEVYNLFRKIALPNITYLSVLKLKEILTSKIYYYFKIFIDYFGEIENPIAIRKQEQEIKETTLKSVEKENIIKARIGQGAYREKLFDECPFCPITMVSDDRLLIASHIKPWSKSNNKEKTDPKNGFLLTPTIDKLFDKGLISFTNDKKMMISPWLSKMTVYQLKLTPNKKYLKLPVDSSRKKYLEYHRKNIFKK